MIAIGLSMFLLGGSYLVYQKSVLTFNTLPQKSIEPTAPIHTNSLPVKIEIPSLNISLPITVSTISEKGIWEISEAGASFLGSSGVPGSDTNTVIYGHNKKYLFGSLVSLKTGDKIFIQSEDGIQHQYIVEETKTVSPNEISVVLPTDEERLTVYTCTGFLDSKRFVVRAKPVGSP